jgi:hypothetical protein
MKIMLKLISSENQHNFGLKTAFIIKYKHIVDCFFLLLVQFDINSFF